MIFQIFDYFEDPPGRVEQWFTPKQKFPLDYDNANDPLYERDIAFTIARVNAIKCHQPLRKKHDGYLWILGDRFMHYIQTDMVNDVHSPEYLEIDRVLANDLLELDLLHEYQWLQHAVDRLHLPLVFSHNDCRLQTIDRINVRFGVTKMWPYIMTDFCMSGFNFRGYDLAGFLQSLWYKPGDFPFFEVHRPFDGDLHGLSIVVIWMFFKL